MMKSKALLPTRSLWFRVTLGTLGSTAAFWIVYKVLLSIFAEGGKLSEFGTITIGLIGGLWTAAAFNWMATGMFIPNPTVEPSNASHDLPIRERFIGSPITITLLSIAWLGIWFYVTVLHDALRGALFDSSTIGVSLSENDAMRILNELAGLIFLGITFPLLAATAFIAGWACSSSLRVPTMLIPATAFCFIAAALNYGAEVLATGRPPIYNAMKVVLRESGGSVTSVDIGFLWLINIIIFPVGCLLFALYGRIWTALGFFLRRSVVKQNTYLGHSSGSGLDTNH